jgi:hypothetical protein
MIAPENDARFTDRATVGWSTVDRRGVRFSAVGRRVVITMAVAMLLGVVAGAAFGASPPRRSGCNNLTFVSTPPVSNDAAPPADAVAELSLLRRAPDAADQLPQINDLALQLSGQLTTYDPAYTRAVATLADGRRLFVIVGTRFLPPLPPPSCLPKKDRAQLLKAIKLRNRYGGPGFCVVATGGAPSEPAQCDSFKQLAQGDTLLDLDPLPTSNGYRPRLLGGLLPDGVATVRVSYRRSPPVTSTATGNFFSFREPRVPGRLQRELKRLVAPRPSARRPPTLTKQQSALLGRLERQIAAFVNPTRIAWIDSNGRLIKQFTPSPNTATGFGLYLSTGDGGTVSTVSIGG